MKANKSKQTNQGNGLFYKGYFILNEFHKIVDEKLFFELEEEHYKFYKKVFHIDMISDFSDYGVGFFDLDYRNYIKGDKCFLCFIKFNLDFFIEFLIILYEKIEADKK